jgi:hypothetical protein
MLAAHCAAVYRCAATLTAATYTPLAIQPKPAHGGVSRLSMGMGLPHKPRALLYRSIPSSVQLQFGSWKMTAAMAILSHSEWHALLCCLGCRTRPRTASASKESSTPSRSAQRFERRRRRSRRRSRTSRTRQRHVWPLRLLNGPLLQQSESLLVATERASVAT